MATKAKASLITAALVVGGIGAGAAVASAALTSGSSPAAQPTGQYVFACVNKQGKIDYLEYRTPLPHQCWYSGEALWHWAVEPTTSLLPVPVTLSVSIPVSLAVPLPVD